MTYTIVNIHIEQCNFKFSVHSYVLSYFNEKTVINKTHILNIYTPIYMHMCTHTHVHTDTKA